jgi:hypothetical protein
MLFIFLIQHSSEKPVRTHRTKMYTKCKFKNMSKNITYDSYRPIISNYYNLVLMLVNHIRFPPWQFVTRPSTVTDAMEFEVISTTTLHQTRTPIQSQTQNPNPWTRSVWNHLKLDLGNSQRSWVPFHNPCRLCGPTWRTCPQRSTD